MREYGTECSIERYEPGACEECCRTFGERRPSRTESAVFVVIRLEFHPWRPPPARPVSSSSRTARKCSCSHFGRCSADRKRENKISDRFATCGYVNDYRGTRPAPAPAPVPAIHVYLYLQVDRYRYILYRLGAYSKQQPRNLLVGTGEEIGAQVLSENGGRRYGGDENDDADVACEQRSHVSSVIRGRVFRNSKFEIGNWSSTGTRLRLRLRP